MKIAEKEDCLIKKILTVVAISTLLLSSGNVIATQTTIDGSLRVTEQLQTQIVNGLVVDVNGEPVIGASVVERYDKWWNN